jgi:hypothetical protein
MDNVTFALATNNTTFQCLFGVALISELLSSLFSSRLMKSLTESRLQKLKRQQIVTSCFIAKVV